MSANRFWHRNWSARLFSGFFLVSLVRFRLVVYNDGMTKKDQDILNDLIDHCRRKAEDASYEDENEAEVAEWRERIRVLSQLQSETCNTHVCPTCHPQLPLKLEYATDDVPWERRGYPGSVRTPENTDRKWKKDVANAGVCKNRLFSDTDMITTHAFGVEERAFAHLWDFEHNGDTNNGILFLIMSEEPVRGLLRDEHDRWLCQLVAQAIVQWLGTNCGRSFIQRAEDMAKADQKRIDSDRKFLHELTSCPTGNRRD